METTTLEQVDKIIESSDLPEMTLSLILGKTSDNGRTAGIFTSYDLNKIKVYINKVLTLPYQKEDVIEFLGYEDINITQLSADNIKTLFLKMREHAFGWNKIEYSIKQQAIDLEIIGREITKTGDQLLSIISQMPLLDKINRKIEDITEDELKDIKYSSRDKKVAIQLISILEEMKSDITYEQEKTLKIKNMISDFRIKIIGGEDSSGNLCDSFYYDILRKKRIAHDYINNDNDALQEEKDILEREIAVLKEEYHHFVKLAFTGLALGIIGVIITGGIFGAKAEEVRKKKNELIERLTIINKEMKSYENISVFLDKLRLDLDEIEQYIEDANMALEHLEYMWQITLTEIDMSLNNLRKIDNLMELIRFSLYLEKMVKPWHMVVGYSKEMIMIFDEALSSFYSLRKRD